MSIDTAEGMEHSEFALTEEEKAELALQQKLEEGEVQNEEVDQEFLDKLLNGDGTEGGESNTPKPDETTNQGDNQGDGQDDNNNNHQQDVDDTAYQQHLANEAARNDWQEKLDQANESKQTLLDELKSLGTKLDDGDVGQGEYEAEKERIKDSLKSQNKLIEQAEKSLEQAEHVYQDYAGQQQQAANQAWYNELHSFVSSNPAYDPKAQNNRYATRFDEVISDLNAKQAFAGLNHKQIIKTVQHRVEMELGTPKQAPVQQEHKKTPKRENVSIPATMSQMTPAATNELGDEFAMLDRLQGLEYEAALEKLQTKNPEAFKRYMSAD